MGRFVESSLCPFVSERTREDVIATEFVDCLPLLVNANWSMVSLIFSWLPFPGEAGGSWSGVAL